MDCQNCIYFNKMMNDYPCNMCPNHVGFDDMTVYKGVRHYGESEEHYQKRMKMYD